MAEQHESAAQLDLAKGRLRDALTRLENVVDAKIENVALASPNDENLTNELTHARKLLREKQDELENIKKSTDNNPNSSELEYIQEENHRLQAEIGQTIEENREMKKLNKKITVRIDSLVDELQAVLMEQGI